MKNINVKKLNNKGFAISIILYISSAVVVLVLFLILSILSTNLINKDTIVNDIKQDFSGINDDNNINVEVVSLKNKIFQMNTKIYENPTLTDSLNNTGDSYGLYKSTATNDGSPTYYFRGNVSGNYVSFAGFTWRIVRINEDGTFRLIMAQDIDGKHVFNGFDTSYTGMYFSESNIKQQLDTWFNTYIVNRGFSSKVATGNYFCEQAKTKYGDSYTSGNTNMTVYSSYIPDFKCSTDENGYGLVNSSVGLINYDEVVHAGGYYDRANSFYYLYNKANYITMSPAGVASDGVAEVWRVHDTGNILIDDVNVEHVLRPVINLKADTMVKGNGTSSDKFIVQ